MAAEYELRLTDQFGNAIAFITSLEKLVYSRAVNTVGTLSLLLDGEFPVTQLAIDNRIQVWRSVGDRLYLDTETIWLIRKVIRLLDSQGRRKIQVVAKSANELLRRRIIAYNAKTSQAVKTDFADDMMKEIVSENLGSGAGVGRDISTYLDIQTDLANGPTLTRSFTRKNVFSTLVKISQATYASGSPVLFDIVSPTPNTLEFRTYRDQRGIDHRHPNGINPVILSPERGNLADVTYTINYEDEYNYVYGGAQGTGTDRKIVTASDTRINLSIFNRREVLFNGTSSASADLTTETDAYLRLGRPKRVFEGRIVNTPQTQYGIHWAWGDSVTATFEGQSINCSIDAVTITVAKGDETIDAKLRADE